MTDTAALRRQLGWLLLWAMLPLPFLYIVLPPFWLTATAAAVVLILKPERSFRPSKIVLNLAGVVILVAVVAAGGLNVGPLRPLGHLLLLLTSVRVLIVNDRRSFLRSLALVGMVWVVSVASSTHVTAAVYFAVSVVIMWRFGIRVHLSGLGLELADGHGELPRQGHVLVAVGMALLIAVPVFLVMPRLGSPWIAGRSFSRSTGFSPDVDLGKMGSLTQSQEVALVITTEGDDRILTEWTRLRGTAFDQVMAGSFIPRRADLQALETTQGIASLRPDVPGSESGARLEIDLLRPRRYLMLPPGAAAIRAPTEMALDVYGGVAIGYRRGEPLSYTVWVDGDHPLPIAPPSGRDVLLPRDNAEVRALALAVAGDLGSARAKAEAVERHLQTEYRYSLDSGVRIHDVDPVAWFLLERREGHCEFFAGSMVVLLRHLGVPVRMVAGYAGGDLSPNGDELVVRESNAHAWVEVWLGPGEGWVTFDPTPPSGVPGLGAVSGLERLRWGWQQLELLWDQKLLTFGLGEQLDLVEGMVAVWHRVASALSDRTLAARAGVVFTLLVFAAVVTVLWRRSSGRGRGSAVSRGPASRTVARLARSLVPVGGVVPPWATVRSIGAQAVAFWPATAGDVRALVRHAEDELYGDDGSRADPGEIKRLWKRIRAGMKHRELSVDG